MAGEERLLSTASSGRPARAGCSRRSTRRPARCSAWPPTAAPRTWTTPSARPAGPSTTRAGPPTSSCGSAACASCRRPSSGTPTRIRAMTVAETGSPLSFTYSAQLDAPVESLGWVADLAERYEWETDLGNAEPLGIPSHRWVRREATGVVGAITPWNVPHQINLAKLGPALAAGNTVVLKPAPDTPWCATVLGRLIAEETDIPAGRGQHRPVVGPRPRGDAVRPTPGSTRSASPGSTATGRKVMASAAETVKKVFLELGGKSAFVDPGRRRPARGVRHGRLHRVHARRSGLRHHHPAAGAPGRSSTRPSTSTAKVMAKLPAGDPTDPGTICGPLISARQRDRVEGYLALAVEEGGSFVLGGGRPDGLDARVLRGADPDRGRRQRRPGGPGGDLRAGPGGHPPRRRRRRRGPGQRLGLRPVRLGVVGRPGPGGRRGQPDPHRHRRRQRRPVVQPRRALRRATGSRASGASRAWPASRSTSRPSRWPSRRERTRAPTGPEGRRPTDRRRHAEGHRGAPRAWPRWTRSTASASTRTPSPGPYVDVTVDHLFGDGVDPRGARRPRPPHADHRGARRPGPGPSAGDPVPVGPRPGRAHRGAGPRGRPAPRPLHRLAAVHRGQRRRREDHRPAGGRPTDAATGPRRPEDRPCTDAAPPPPSTSAARWPSSPVRPAGSARPTPRRWPRPAPRSWSPTSTRTGPSGGRGHPRAGGPAARRGRRRGRPGVGRGHGPGRRRRVRRHRLPGQQRRHLRRHEARPPADRGLGVPQPVPVGEHARAPSTACGPAGRP